MPKGAGKPEVAVDRIQELVDRGAQISGLLSMGREEVEKGAMPQIMKQFGPDASREDLRVMASSTVLGVGGYDDTEAEIYEIPEVREFFRQQNKQWAPWIFLGSVWTADFMAIALACLPRVTCWRKDGEIFVEWTKEDMSAFVNLSVQTTALLHVRAGIDRNEGCAKLQATAAYLGIS